MKTAISVTLGPDNLLWLKARAQARGSRSISATLDDLLNEARRNGGPARSVMGTVRLPQGEAGLKQGDRDIQQLLAAALGAEAVRKTRRRG